MTREQNHTQAHKNNLTYSRANLVKANLVTSIDKSLEISLDTNLTSKLLAMHTHILIYMPYASSKGQFQHGEAKYGVLIAGKSSPFTIITVLPLIQSAIGIILDSKNAATAS